MMKSFASFTLSGKLPAFTIVFGFLILAFLFPLSAILSGAAIVLITIHAGPKNALSIVIASILALAICSFLILKNPLLGATTGLAQLLPSFIIASIFYTTRSLSLSMQMAALVGAVSFILFSLLFPDNAQFWQKTLSPMLTPVLETSGYSKQESMQMIAQTSEFMLGLLIASIVLVHSSILLLGYLLYCQTTNSTQFSQDFRQMRLGKVLAIACVTIGVIAIATKSSFAAQLCAILAILFFLQGMAVIHTTCGTMTKGKLWLIIAYFLVIFVPQTIVVVILLGISETFLKLRERAA